MSVNKILVTVVVCLLISTVELFALSINPPVVEVELEPDEAASINFYINASSQESQLSTFITSWKLSEDQSIVRSTENTTWVGFDHLMGLNPSQNQQVKRTMSFKAPHDFEGERRVFLVLLEMTPGAMFATEMKTPIYIMSAKNKKMAIEIVDVTVNFTTESTKNGLEMGSLNSCVVMKNNGNVHLRPEVFMKLKNKQTGEYIRNKQGSDKFLIARDWPVFPEVNRNISDSAKDVILEKHGKYIIEIQANFKYLFNDALAITKNYEVDL